MKPKHETAERTEGSLHPDCSAAREAIAMTVRFGRYVKGSKYRDVTLRLSKKDAQRLHYEAALVKLKW